PVGAQHPASVDRRYVADRAIVDDDRHAELLTALAHERFRLALTRLHLAAGQLPSTGERVRVRTLGGEQPRRVAVDDRRRDDDHGHPDTPPRNAAACAKIRRTRQTWTTQGRPPASIGRRTRRNEMHWQ